MCPKFCSVVLLVGPLWMATAAQADEIPVAVAANFAAPFKEIAAAFEEQTGHTVVASFGSTGKLYAQIKHGAPFEAFLAADDETPKKLIGEGAAVAGTPFTYAVGKLVLWSARSGVVDEAGGVLQRGGFAHIAMANPKLAPYGAAAWQTMTRLGVHERLRPKIVTADSIAQAHQFVSSGNSELGFLAMSQVLKEGEVEGSVWVVPADLYDAIQQDAVLLTQGKGKAGALALMKFLQGDKARALIRSFGYGLPD
ncbi:MAG TPA: molybdate ABC transporter substrate-binding protein [Hydrogenophaga sp.]